MPTRAALKIVYCQHAILAWRWEDAEYSIAPLIAAINSWQVNVKSKNLMHQNEQDIQGYGQTGVHLPTLAHLWENLSAAEVKLLNNSVT